jgi:hypothetical protein
MKSLLDIPPGQNRPAWPRWLCLCNIVAQGFILLAANWNVARINPANDMTPDLLIAFRHHGTADENAPIVGWQVSGSGRGALVTLWICDCVGAISTMGWCLEFPEEQLETVRWVRRRSSRTETYLVGNGGVFEIRWKRRRTKQWKLKRCSGKEQGATSLIKLSANHVI